MVGVLAAYALVLYGFAFSIAAASMATAGHPQVISFETCLPDKGAGPNFPEAPRTDYGEHCAFCLAGGAHALTAPTPVPLDIMFVSSDSAWQPISNWHPLPFTAYRNGQPRGPPPWDAERPGERFGRSR